jgi:hypothetical protein
MPGPVTVIPGKRFAVPLGIVTVVLLNTVVAAALRTTAGNVKLPDATVVFPTATTVGGTPVPAKFNTPLPVLTN